MTKFLERNEKKINDSGITIRFLDGTVPTSIEDCVNIAFRMKSTVINNPHKVYKISDYNRRQSLGSTRSIQDLYMIAKHYFPEATIMDVHSILKKLKDKKNLHAHWCSTFRRMMFRKGQSYYLPNLSNYGL